TAATARAAFRDLLGQTFRVDSSGNSVGRVRILRDSPARASAFVSGACTSEIFSNRIRGRATHRVEVESNQKNGRGQIAQGKSRCREDPDHGLDTAAGDAKRVNE